MNQIYYKDLGIIPYKEAWDFQEKLMNEKVSKKLNPDNTETIQNHLLLCRHPHVYTLGMHGNQENLLLNSASLKEKGIEFYKTNRGGDITYHGPGQLVAYPILDLEQFGGSIKVYLRSLEEVVIRTIAEFGIASGRIEGITGVWIEPETVRARKICALGVRCNHWISLHGLALNINTDLSYFRNIVPCGLTDKGVSSMKEELGTEVDEAKLTEIFLEKFGEVFGSEIRKAEEQFEKVSHTV